MSETDALLLALHRPRIEKRRRFDERVRMGAAIDPDEVYDLVLAETGSKERAAEAMSNWLAQLLKREDGSGE